MTPSSIATTRSHTTTTYDRRTPPEKRQAFVMDKETEDAIVQCNPGGCAITAQEVETNLSGTYPVVPGSLKFRGDQWTDEENTALFTVQLRDGGSILGSVTIKAVVEPTKLTAFSDIRVINVKGQPVPLVPKRPKAPAASSREAVVARHLGRRPSP